MGNTLTLAYNKVQYMIAKNLSDPEADNYAKQQAAQAEQDAEAKKRKVEAAKNASEAEQQKKEQQEAAYMNMSHSEREAYKKILQEQRVSTTVKKAQDDEMIGIGHILLIITIVLAIFGGMFFGAVALGLIHR